MEINSTITGVSFIIPTWNKKDMVIKCLQLLSHRLSIEYPEIPKEIIVIDNGSTDDSYSSIKTFFQKNKLPNLQSKIYHLKSNLGFAKAVNLAAKQSKFDYLYLLNNDMEVQSGFFKEIIDTANKLLKQNITFFGIASQIFFFDPSIKRVESGKTWTEFKNGKLLVGHELNPKKLQKVSPIAYCGGGSSLISKKIFNLLGGFDSQVYIPMYGEDLDMGFVAWKKRLSLILLSQFTYYSSPPQQQ